MSEKISTSRKDTYRSETCSKREHLTVVFQQRGAWPAQLCTYIDLYALQRATRLMQLWCREHIRIIIKLVFVVCSNLAKCQITIYLTIWYPPTTTLQHQHTQSVYFVDTYLQHRSRCLQLCRQCSS